MTHSSRTLVSFSACIVSLGVGAPGLAAPPRFVAQLPAEGGVGTAPSGVMYPQAISESGLAVGYAWEYGRPARGWAWDGASMRSLQPPAGMENAWTYATSVNSRGVIAGTIEYNGTSYGATWTNEGVNLLAPINPGDAAGAAAINDFGVVTGGSWPGGIVWREGAPAKLPLMDGATRGSAFLVNNSGMFAGYGLRPGQRAYPARWTESGGEWLTLPTEPAGAQEFVGTQLTGMNDRGDVIGWTTRLGFSGTGQLWRASGELVSLAKFDPENPGLVVPSGINDREWVVGFHDEPDTGRGAFLWIDGRMYDLAGLVDGLGVGAELLSVSDINDDGTIVGTAVVDGRQVPVLLTAVPGPAAPVGLLAMAALVAARRRR